MVTTFDSRIAWSDTTREVKRALPVRQALRLVGWRVHGRRADCGLCKGRSITTVAFTERLWKCHRCQQGGSIFDLVMRAHNCDFMTALKFLAAEARIELSSDKKLSVEQQRRLHREREERERREGELDEATDELLAGLRSMRRRGVKQIHRCDQILRKPAPWSEADWSSATGAFARRANLLAEYSLLSFGSMDDRIRYLRTNQQQRTEMLDRIRMHGGFYATDDEDDRPHFVELGAA